MENIMPKSCQVEKKITKDGKVITICDETRANLMPVLQKIQIKNGFISDDDMQEVASQFGIHPVEVYAVVSFYSFLSEKKKGKNIIRVSNCVSAELAGNADVVNTFEKALKIKCGETTSDGEFTLEMTSCIGMCDNSPAIMVNDTLVGSVELKKINKILDACKKGEIIPGTYQRSKEDRSGSIVFKNNADYAGLRNALEMDTKAVLDTISDSELKGRGGAGFPTGLKLSFAANTKDEVKYIVCNADEGEPGTFKDRVLLTEYAQDVFEGMAIAGYAIGAANGILYLRGEYISFVPQLEEVLVKMRQDNMLGEKILGKEFYFDISIRLGSGAYICGEETALIESMEGNRGELRNRPPFIVNTGFMGHPTIVNNVETCVDMARVLADGAEAFKAIGTEKSKGTKLISVSGDCKNPGVYEIAFGMSINQILDIAGGKGARAVQVGGASGTCLVEAEFDKTIAYEDVPTGGSIMIFNKKRKMLDIAYNFLEFFKEESCGQCTPCREGVPVLIEILEEIESGTATEEKYAVLESLAETMQCASKCGLGQAASLSLMAILERFKDEYKLA